MFQIYFIAASAALLCGSASAQHRLAPSRMFPITTPIKNAGSVDVTTGKWVKPGQQVKIGSQTIFNNTCTWVIGGYYGGFDWCEDNYDEGRLPSPSDPNAPGGAEVSNTILSIQVSYCTFAGPQAGAGGYDMDLAFYDKLNGDCVGVVAPTPPPVSATATAYIPLAGLGLPGSTGVGFQACWLITLDMSNSGMVLASDGEGTFDGVGADDKFIWMQRQNTTVGALNGLSPDGFFIAGDPAIGGFGTCSYNIPCGVNPITGRNCGTGLGAFDGSWINVDGIAVGASNQPAGCVNSVAQYGFGTNCYFFGGYPSNAFASYWLVLESDGRFVEPQPFCPQTKPTSVVGCTASFTITDLSLATGTWNTTNIPRAANTSAGTTVGIYIFTHSVGAGQSTFSANVPFGTLCLQGFKRSAASCAPASALTQPGICNAVNLTTAVNCNNGALGIAVGEDVNAQCWYRDQGAVGDTNFSNAIFYTVQ